MTIRGAKQDGVQVGDFAVDGGAGRNNILHGLVIFGSGASGVYINGATEEGGNANTVEDCLIGVRILP